MGDDGNVDIRGAGWFWATDGKGRRERQTKGQGERKQKSKPRSVTESPGPPSHRASGPAP
jgi:hypothetical protein